MSGAAPSEPAAQPQKVGLALSGGGFRASFFHIGVLARLAELGLLRQVEAISTVSGGSIVGALYYVRVKNLLETRRDGEIGDADYVELVKRVERDFMDAVRKNIRTRALANVVKNFKMASPRYSRSDRIGDLYDRFLYKPAWKDVPDELAEDRKLARRWGGLVEEQIAMRRLKIHPKDDPNGAEFNPRRHNDARQAKVPVLMINATTLNTGHAWRFEASRMGEPPPLDAKRRDVVEDVDKNVRFAQADYDAMPPRPREMPLGLAVAASACVPMLFHPLAISGLYKDVRVQLVDGGVHDNQGIEALIDTDCTHLILSDASGQMPDDLNPITRIPAVAGRSISIYGDSLRDEQLIRADADGRHVALMHLRKGIAPKVLRPIGVAGGDEEVDEKRMPPITCTDFGIREEVQELLARFRTDLDSFTEIEAYSLGIDAYRMSNTVIARNPKLAALGNGAPTNEAGWDFGAVGDLTVQPTPVYLRQLAAAKERFFKTFALVPGLRHAPKLAAAAALVALVVWRWGDLTGGSISVAAAAIVAAVVIAYFSLGKTPVLRQLSGFTTSFVAPIVLAIPAWALSLVVLAVNPIFLRLGRAPRPAQAPGTAPVPGSP